jgi:hypothetical protein
MKKYPLKLNVGKLLAWNRANIWLMRNWDINSDHDLLLLHHMLEFKQLHEKQLSNEQKKYTLKLTQAQVLAFCQMWKEVDFSKHMLEMPYEATVVLEMNGEIDRYRKSLIQLQYEQIHDDSTAIESPELD